MLLGIYQLFFQIFLTSIAMLFMFSDFVFHLYDSYNAFPSIKAIDKCTKKIFEYQNKTTVFYITVIIVNVYKNFIHYYAAVKKATSCYWALIWQFNLSISCVKFIFVKIMAGYFYMHVEHQFKVLNILTEHVTFGTEINGVTQKQISQRLTVCAKLEQNIRR